MLPYKTLRPAEEVVIAGFPMIKRGCLTIAEMQAAADLGAAFDQKTEGMTALQSDLFMRQHIATIMIRSRVDRGWTLEQTQADLWHVMIDGKQQAIEPDVIMLDELFEFYLGEQRRWKEPQPEAEASEAGKKQLTGHKSTGS